MADLPTDRLVGRADDPVQPLPGWLAIALVVGTSAAVLVLEILAGRVLAPYVGVSLETYTGIIGTVLLGIAVGAWAGGTAADHIDPRRLIPVLLVTGGGLAVATIPIVRAVGTSSGTSGESGILVLAGLGFLPTATVLSAIPPAVVKLQLRDLDATGSTVGRLSAYGTAGAIVGTFVTGFVLVAVAAVSTLILTVGMLLVAAGGLLWLALPRPERSATRTQMSAVSMLAVLAVGGVAVTDSPCTTQTAYYCVSIVVDDDREGGRTLVLDDLRHSYVDLDDPAHLEFWYSRRVADSIDELGPSGPLDIVHIGGGALTIPSRMQVTRPGSDQTVFEIDADLVALVVDEFERTVGPGSGVAVVVGDARLSLADVDDDSVDVVIGDAFGSRSVPWHLATTEFAAEIDRVLRPGGLYVINLIDSARRRFLRAEAATIGDVFAHVAVVLGPAAAQGGSGNSVIIGSDQPIDVGALERRLRLAGDDGLFVDDVDGLIDGAPVLTDDFAPVDQLISSGS